MKNEVIQKIIEEKIIVIVRNVEKAKIIPLVQAMHDGGIRLIEVTFSDSFCGVLKMADYYSDCFGKDRSFISFMFFADVGNLFEGLFSEKRRCQVNQMHKHEYLFVYSSDYSVLHCRVFI